MPWRALRAWVAAALGGAGGAAGQGGIWDHPGSSLPSGGSSEPPPALGDFVGPPLGRVVAGGTSGGCGTLASGEAAGLENPVALAVGPAGTVFILDRDCLRITSAIVAGGTNGGGDVEVQATEGGFANNLRAPQGLFFHQDSGDLYIADSYNHRILRWRPGDLQGELVIEGHFLTPAGELAYPSDMALQGSALFVLETRNNRVQLFNLATCCADPSQAIGTVLLGCPESAIPGATVPDCAEGFDRHNLWTPGHLAVTAELEVFVADTANHRVVRFDASNLTSLALADVVAGVTGMPGCGPEQLRQPAGVAVDAEGYLYVADTGNHRVQKFAPRSGSRLGLTIAGECCCPRLLQGIPVGGSGLHQLNQPLGLAVAEASATLLVADRGNHRVLAFGLGGATGAATGEEAPRAPGASCAYGAECVVRLQGLRRPLASNQILVARRNTTAGPCGRTDCVIPSWPGLTNPKAVSGDFLDTYSLGTPLGPPDRTSSGLGEYTLCFARAPSLPCTGGGCGGEDNCTNSSSWLCGGAEPFGIRRLAWQGVPGDDLASLRSWPAYPDEPDVVEELQTFETPSNWGDNYGQVLSGLFVAPETGTYVFHVTSDEHSELRVSNVFNETVGPLVAYISESEVWWTGGFPHYGYARGPDDWSSFASQSGSVELEAGQLYWVEVIHKEGLGVDHLRVGVTLPGGVEHKPIPAAFFEGRACFDGEPRGLGVVHDCYNKTTGQSCTAECRSGFAGERRTFWCDGLGRFLGVDPICWSVTCEDYDVEIGSFFMHGVLGQVDCSGMGGTDCAAKLSSWAGPGTCVSFVATYFETCREYCERRGRPCVKAMDDAGACTPHVAGHGRQTTAEEGCLQRWQDQLCVCGRRRPEYSPCLLQPWCMLGLMISGDVPLGLHADDGGNIFAVDTYRHVAARWRWGTRTWEPVAGGRGAGNGLEQLRGPCGLRFARGELYVADTGNHRLVRWAEGASAGVLAFGTGVAGGNASELRYPIGVSEENDTMYVVDYGNGRVLRLLEGQQHGEALPVDEAVALEILPNTATDSFFDGAGRYYRVDHESHSLWVCSHTLQCDFSACKEVNAAAQYGSTCGCPSHNTTCWEVFGVIPS